MLWLALGVDPARRDAVGRLATAVVKAEGTAYATTDLIAAMAEWRADQRAGPRRCATCGGPVRRLEMIITMHPDRLKVSHRRCRRAIERAS